MQRGTIYHEYQSGGKTIRLPNWVLKYRVHQGGKVVNKSATLCAVNGSMHHDLCNFVGEHRSEKTLDQVRTAILSTVNAQNKDAAVGRESDMRVVDFWSQRYVPYCSDVLPVTKKSRKKASTVRSYKQIWQQHLVDHFGDTTLRQYVPTMGTRFLRTLISTQNRNTISHIKALMGSIFELAKLDERITTNPMRDVQFPKDAVAPNATRHYTMEQAEDIISALVDHVDAQLVMSLLCFLGLRPSECAALRWEDFDAEQVHIRRGLVRRIIDTPKSASSVASLPLIDQVRVPLLLWNQACGSPKEGWLFPAKSGDLPIDISNLARTVIIPICKAAHIEWKGLHAGRRGCCTAVIESTNGNYAVAQALLRHKSMKTTLDVYKKAITANGFKAGMAQFQKALTEGGK
jgi:integrase